MGRAVRQQQPEPLYQTTMMELAHVVSTLKFMDLVITPLNILN
jgi:hypothetical protein